MRATVSAFSQSIDQTPGHLAKNFVSGRMPKKIVYILESIEIDK